MFADAIRTLFHADTTYSIFIDMTNDDFDFNNNNNIVIVIEIMIITIIILINTNKII